VSVQVSDAQRDTRLIGVALVGVYLVVRGVFDFRAGWAPGGNGLLVILGAIEIICGLLMVSIAAQPG